MKLIIKCWKSKQGKTVKGLFYENKNGRFLLTFDKFAIVSLIGGKHYNALKEDEEITASAVLDEEGGAT